MIKDIKGNVIVLQQDNPFDQVDLVLCAYYTVRKQCMKLFWRSCIESNKDRVSLYIAIANVIVYGFNGKLCQV